MSLYTQTGMNEMGLGERSAGHRLAYQPALDGVRAVAVIAVLLFHGQVPGFDGGYLGVSVFFTLSGYLITSLLITENDRSGRVDLGGFYSRRIRRLMPASVVCIAAIGIIAAVTNAFALVADLRRQMLGALLQVANWVQLAGEGSYQELFAASNGAVSPLEHFWSLAVEEQFYWMWPVMMWLIMRRVNAKRIAAVGLLAIVFSISAPVIAVVFGADAAYWATPARVAEILIGAFVAVWLPSQRIRRWWSVLAQLAALALMACIVMFPAVGGPAYRGFLPLVAVISAALIVGLQTPGALTSGLSIRPLVWLGKISYGVYLYHWPVFVLVDTNRVEIDGWLLFSARMAITLAVAIVSFVLIERPIRYPRRKVGAGTVLAFASSATVAVAVATVSIVPTTNGDYWQVDQEAAGKVAIDADQQPGALMATTPASIAPASASVVTTTPGSTAVAGSSTTAPSTSRRPTTGLSTTAPSTTAPQTTPLPQLARPVRIISIGDSTAKATAKGLVTWAAANPGVAQVEDMAVPGCGFMTGGQRLFGGEWADVHEGCRQQIETQIPDRVTELQPDVVMALMTSWDLVDHRWEGVNARSPLDPEFRQRMLDEYLALTDRIVEAGAPQVVWIKPPVPRNWISGEAVFDPQRFQVLIETIDAVAAERPDTVTVIDLNTWINEQQMGLDPEVRPDGTHWSDAAGLRIANDFLGPQLLQAAISGTQSVLDS